MFSAYDIIVVGGGHAGCEATLSAAKMNLKVLMITHHLTSIGMMSCNPSIGGVGKGQLVREIDALGGLTGVVADLSMVQMRMLNKSKGPAMWSPRSQNDRRLYSFYWRKFLEENINVDFWQDSVVDLIIKYDKVIGVKTELGLEFFSKSVIITSGTFLNGKIYIGTYVSSGGRIGENKANNLTESLNKLGIESCKLKTGTSARIDGRSIDFSNLVEQPGDEPIFSFSFSNRVNNLPQLSCYITNTSEEVHDILKTGFNQSPLFTGMIEGTGPRYCPSIEDKLIRFSDKTSHHLFLEPEGRDTYEYYINGFSSSLPFEVQKLALSKVKGLEKAKLLRPGYAIEYDFFPPTQLHYTLESKLIENLFFAGQVNGTTGYEEAAAQGLIAGINASLKIKNEKSLVLQRNQAYLGVLVDDLVSKGVDEPYRLFTSRAEYRLLLRQSNADYRLTEIGYNLGIQSQQNLENCNGKYSKINSIIKSLKEISVSPDTINSYLNSVGSSVLTQKTSLYQLLLRTEVELNALIENNIFQISELDFSVQEIEEAQIIVKYGSYIEREREISEKLSSLDSIKLRTDFEYYKLNSLSTEAREKLTKIRPQNIGQASRIPGISPADINALIVYLKK